MSPKPKPRKVATAAETALRLHLNKAPHDTWSHLVTDEPVELVTVRHHADHERAGADRWHTHDDETGTVGPGLGKGKGHP